jgi:hypothetical protein
MGTDRRSERVVDEALVRDVTRALIVRVAPQELPLFRASSERWFADHGGELRRGRGQEVLGFGAEAAVVLLTPVALGVVSDVLSYLAVDYAKGVAPRGLAAVRAALRRLFRVVPEEGVAAEAPVMTGEQLARVRSVAFERAIALDLPEAKAALLADALLGALSVPPPTTSPSVP